MKLTTWIGLAVIGLLLILGGIGVGIVFLFRDGRAGSFPPEVTLPVLLVAGVIGLLITLSLTAALFKSLDLTSPGQPLGLPEGSVQSVIALSLILIFVISAVFLFAQLEPMTVSKGLTESQAAQITKDVGTRFISMTKEVDGTFDVTLQSERNGMSQDFAKQMLATISTLVVAVAGFYFGSRSATTAFEKSTSARGRSEKNGGTESS